MNGERGRLEADALMEMALAIASGCEPDGR
jgi:hypothetical protein